MDILNPVFIVGVPRSGTTLLRVILDSHTKIASAPETPWILGGYGQNSIRHLAEFLINDEYGPVKNLPGIDSNAVMSSVRLFLNGILMPYLSNRGKDVLVLKTPDDIKYLEFLVELYPGAKFIHIFRDGRDASCSLVENACSLFADQIEDYGELSHLNALRRWYEWELKVRAVFDSSGVDYFRIKYEHLVTDSCVIVESLCKYLGVSYEPGMMNYSRFDHVYPAWEAGSYDLREKKTIDDDSIGKWRERFNENEKLYSEKLYGNFLQKLGYNKSS